VSYERCSSKAKMHKRVQAYTKLNCCYHCCVSLDFYCLLLFFSFYLTFTLLLPGKRQLLASFVSFCNGMGGLEDPRLLCSSACMIIHLSNFVEHQLLTDGHRHDNNKYHSAIASLNINYETNSWCGELPLNRCICMCKYDNIVVIMIVDMNLNYFVQPRTVASKPSFARNVISCCG